ncbi:MAG: DUF4350 domain-containing protein [Thermodesulfobacteriota bacterium]
MKRQILIVVGALVVVTVLSLWLGGSGKVDRSRLPSTFSTGPEGCKAVYLALQELGLEVSRFRRAYQWLGKHRGTLIAVDPGKMVVRARELSKLKEWIRKGNHLIFFEGTAPLRMPWERDDKEATEERSKGDRVRKRSNFAREFGLTRMNSSVPGRRTVPVVVDGVEGVGEISASKDVHWKEPKPPWKTLVADESGPLVVARKLGAGKVIAFADLTMITNKYVKEDHNLRFLLAMLYAEGRPKEILFDEYHHGHVMAGSLWQYIGASVFLWVLLQCGVGCVLFLYSRRAGLAGRFRSLSPATGRSSLEQVASMAHIFESCRAGSEALNAILRRTLAGISRRRGVPLKSLEDGTFAKKGPRASGELQEVSRLVAECRKSIRAGDTPEKYLALARELMEAHDRIVTRRR